MGRESTVTFEQIAAVADAMKLENVKPTSRGVRARIGDTGSMGTINKMLQRWKAGQERQVSAALVLPPALQRALLEFMDSELTRARSTLEAELAEQQQEAADLATENERQVVENDSQAQAIDVLRAEVSTHQGRAGQLESDLVAAREEAARERSGAEMARTELAKAQLRLEAMPRLEADLVAARAALDTERQARVSAEQSAAVLASQKQDLESRLASQKSDFEGRMNEVRARVSGLEKQLDQAQDLAERNARTAGDALGQVGGLEKSLEYSTRQADEAKVASTEAARKSEIRVKELTDQAAGLQNTVQVLSEQVRMLMAEAAKKETGTDAPEALSSKPAKAK